MIAPEDEVDGSYFPVQSSVTVLRTKHSLLVYCINKSGIFKHSTLPILSESES